MNPVCQLEWDDGVLRTSGPDLPVQTWTRPAELAAARLALLPPVASLDLTTGADLLTAAFAVMPFVAEPFPAPVFGDGVTMAARAAFALFLGPASDDFRVLRGEPDDFLVCARRHGDIWTVGAFTVATTTLTVRFEDLWYLLPPELQHITYTVEVTRDPHAKDGEAARTAGVVRETLLGVAPDARICLDLLAGGGFTLKFAVHRDEGLHRASECQ